jgi:hypothetical protein
MQDQITEMEGLNLSISRRSRAKLRLLALTMAVEAVICELVPVVKMPNNREKLRFSTLKFVNRPGIAGGSNS